MSDGIVIAGGGLAGQRCAETLRRAGYEGRIRMLCGEPRPAFAAGAVAITSAIPKSASRGEPSDVSSTLDGFTSR